MIFHHAKTEKVERSKTEKTGTGERIGGEKMAKRVGKGWKRPYVLVRVGNLLRRNVLVRVGNRNRIRLPTGVSVVFMEGILGFSSV